MSRAYQILLLAAVAALGCGRGPTPPSFPEIDPWAAAAEAIRLYDSDSDGQLSSHEFQDCPALLAAIKRVDRDANGSLSQEELETHLRAWMESGTALVGSIIQVTYDGTPLAGAEVSLEPEPFLGDGYRSATGVTDADGFASFSGHDPVLPGLHLGFYRVRISKRGADGKELLPEKYNEQTSLGVEVAADKGNLALFRLASR